MGARGKQIRHYLNKHPEITHYAILDDMMWDFKDCNLVFKLVLTDGSKGLVFFAIGSDWKNFNMITIIAGSRTITDYNLLLNCIKESGFDITEVVCGGARGPDLLGADFAIKNNIMIKDFPAKWEDLSPPCVIKINKFGKKYNALAGHNRNEEMARYTAQENGGLILIWDGKSAGSKNMLSLAKKYNLKIFEKVIE